VLEIIETHSLKTKERQVSAQFLNSLLTLSGWYVLRLFTEPLPYSTANDVVLCSENRIEQKQMTACSLVTCRSYVLVPKGKTVMNMMRPASDFCDMQDYHAFSKETSKCEAILRACLMKEDIETVES
jgi:putative hemolysin